MNVRVTIIYGQKEWEQNPVSLNMSRKKIRKLE